MDFDEIVMVPGRGQITLGTAVREFNGLSAPPAGSIRVTSFYRAAGCEPAIYAFDEIEHMAAALGKLDVLVSDFQSAWIDRYLDQHANNDALYRARQALREHPGYKPEMERGAVFAAERIANEQKRLFGA
jgi:hypothetical protein